MTKSRENLISLKFGTKASKFFEKLNRPDKLLVWKAIGKIRDDPFVGKPLTGMKEYRKVRAGNYRVIYTFQKKEIQILVVKIGQRQDVYKDLN